MTRRESSAAFSTTSSLVCGINLERRAMQRPRDRDRGDPSPKRVAHRRTDAAHAHMFFFEFNGETLLTNLVECFLQVCDDR